MLADLKSMRRDLVANHKFSAESSPAPAFARLT